MITVYSEQTSARLNYLLQVFFKEILDVPFTLIHEETETIHINYSQRSIQNTFQIVPQGLLFENTISERQIEVIQRKDNYFFSFFKTNGTLDFDLFSAAFYLITRYEEYLPSTKDHHDRYLAYNSIAYKNNFLETPLVNNWIASFKTDLENMFQFTIPFKTEFKIINTLDIDNAFAYKYKGFKRTAGSQLKSLLQFDFTTFNLRKKVIKGSLQDPYDTYEYLKKITLENKTDTYIFILLGDFGGYDRNISHTQQSFAELIQSLSEWSTLGIHPSYKSYLDRTQVANEMNRLQHMISRPIIHSRQHFLKLRIPDSYELLATLDVKEDFSMGYAESFGFRASICTPFSFYNLKTEQHTSLTIRPFAYMDGTLNEYQHLTNDEAIDVIRSLKESVKNVNGHFIGIWHNDTIGENLHWKGWQKVYESAIK